MHHRRSCKLEPTCSVSLRLYFDGDFLFLYFLPESQSPEVQAANCGTTAITETASAYLALGQSACARGQHENGIQKFNQGLTAAMSAMPSSHPIVCETMVKLSRAYIKLEVWSFVRLAFPCIAYNLQSPASPFPLVVGAGIRQSGGSAPKGSRAS